MSHKLLPVYHGVTAFVLEPLNLSGVKWSVKIEGCFFFHILKIISLIL